MHVGKAMILYERAEAAIRPRGRPRASSSPSDIEEEDDDAADDVGPVSKRPRKIVPEPIFDVRFDNVGHLPVFKDAKNASKCRKQGCKSKTRTMCTKCEIYLCIVKNNCFHAYHTK